MTVLYCIVLYCMPPTQLNCRRQSQTVGSRRRRMCKLAIILQMSRGHV